MNNPVRSSGVQLHITSLPGGRLGREAYKFVDWLASAGQSWWQVLPLGPPDRYHSPYKSSSAFATWPGLLADRRAPVSTAEISAFRERQRFWIGDWERFSSRGAIADQVRFDREWGALGAYARERGVRILGDVAIYVSPGGADHRAHPELFQTGLVAGAPPDAYATDGQLWGNPLYEWPALQRRGYRWWVERVRRTLDLFDLARIDHFRGFVAYWAVPAGARTAKHGSWKRGPGRALFRALEAGLGGQLPLVAEDLGVITEPVERLRREIGLPGMLVIQFGMDPDDPTSPHRLANHTADRIVYTATHDQDTVRGWLQSLEPRAARVRGRRGRPARVRRATAAVVGPDPAGLLLAGGGGDDPGPGRARPGQRGAHERSGQRRGQLALADARGSADQDSGRAAARGHRGGRPAALNAQLRVAWAILRGMT